MQQNRAVKDETLLIMPETHETALNRTWFCRGSGTAQKAIISEQQSSLYPQREIQKMLLANQRGSSFKMDRGEGETVLWPHELTCCHAR